MKIYVGVIAYNEEDFIEASLRSVYDYVDQIIVIDGSPWGESTDRTVDIARSVGPKVKAFRGTWKNKSTDHKMIQRQAYIDMMPKDSKDWCILHDADEAWDDENLIRLIEYMRNSDPQTMLFSYQWRHIFGDCWHYIQGGSWDKSRRVGAFRLVPNVCQFNHHIVGVREKNGGCGQFQKLDFPGHITLKDVMFFHYGQAQSQKKQEFRSRYYFIRDKRFRMGYKTWEDYYREVFLPRYEVRMKQPNVLPYDGLHPKAIQPLIGTFWRKEE